MLPKEPYKKIAVIIMYILAAIILLRLFFSYLWEPLLPFILAYGFAECVKPIVKYGEKHKKFPTKITVLAVIFVSSAALFLLIYALINEIYGELNTLSQNIENSLSRVKGDDRFAEEIIEKINSLVPFADIRERLWEIRGNLDAELGNFLVSFADKLSGSIIPILSKILSFVPNLFLAFAAFIVAAYYFSVDRVKISRKILSLFPEKGRIFLKKTKDELSDTVFRYIRANLLILLITFTELLIAFLIMGIKYSFVLALIVSVIDILPVLGTGTVLVPWALYCLVFGSYGRGIGLLAAYAVITVVRQLIEPKIIGKYTGLHPLPALVAMYAGFCIMGVAGLFVFPLSLVLICRIIGKEKSNSCSPPEKPS